MPILPTKARIISVAIISLLMMWLKLPKGGSLTVNKIKKGKSKLKYKKIFHYNK